MSQINEFLESCLEIPWILVGKKQTIETLINEEAVLLTNCLRNKLKKWKLRLEYTRFFLLGYTDQDPDLEGLIEYYVDWWDYDEYLMLQRQSDNLRIASIKNDKH